MNRLLITSGIILGLIEPIFYFLLITVMGFRRRNYHLEENYISELSSINIPRHGVINFISFGLLGLSVGLHAIALSNSVMAHPLLGFGTGCLLVAALGLILLAIVPTEPSGNTLRSKSHRSITFLPAAGIPLGILTYSLIFLNDPNWQPGWSIISIILASLILISDQILLNKPLWIIGLIQRLGVGFALLWIFLTSLGMLLK